MIEHIRALGDQRGAVAACGLDDGFDRLLAEFLRAFCGPAREEPGRVRACGIGPFPRLNGGGKAVQRIGIHPCTSIPAAAICAFASAIENSPKWKIEAASTAEALPSITPSARCSSVPTPPDAITGTPAASATARVSARS